MSGAITLEKKREKKKKKECPMGSVFFSGTSWENDFFQVRTAGSGVRGWLDASHETNNWLKYIRSTSSPHAVNMRHVLIGGQVITDNKKK